MIATIKPKMGDWVRFYANGVLVIGCVEYVRVDTVLGDHELYTTAGAVDSESVLELRRKP